MILFLRMCLFLILFNSILNPLLAVDGLKHEDFLKTDETKSLTNCVKFTTQNNNSVIEKTDTRNSTEHSDEYIDSLNNSIDKHYTEVGATIGTPAMINIVIGRWFGGLGLKLSGMYLDAVSGAQLELCAKFFEDRKKTFSISGLFGSSKYLVGNGNYWSETRTFDYLGLSLNLNYNGFYIQFGFALSNGESYSYNGLLQIGYVHRFW